ncbi:hypothetical protein KR009_006029 [Drosophila setifemur]|nr:hypothetical protein KR009_006029 [Drosophila setifemur]
MPYLNPARSLGPSFVLNKWDTHWVYWFGPLVGGMASGLVYEYIFNSRRNLRHAKGSIDNDSSSIHSEDELNYDIDMEKPSKYQQSQGTYPRGQSNSNGGGQAAGNGQHSNANMGQMPRVVAGAGQGNYCQNLYTAPPLSSKYDQQQEPLYGGTRSLYCRSPTLTRSNLNRSQSVYAKSNTAINRDIVPRPGPLVPAQSLYPMSTQQQQQQHQQQQAATAAQSSHLQNQNVQNQMVQRSESIYGMRGSIRGQQQPLQQQQQQQMQQQQATIQQQQMQQPPPMMADPQQQQQQQQPQGFQPVYGTRTNPTPMDGNQKYERRDPQQLYGMTGPRNRGQSAQSDDSSYGSYHGAAVTPPARHPSVEPSPPPPPMIMYAPPPQPNAAHPQPIRTQSERKVSAPVVASQAAACAVTYTTSQASAVATQQQQQQQQLMMQQQQHYGMLPHRPN